MLTMIGMYLTATDAYALYVDEHLMVFQIGGYRSRNITKLYMLGCCQYCLSHIVFSY